MAEDKRDNPYPYPTATDVAGAPGDRETKAARNIISRNITGIPKRGFVLGEADNAPIIRGIKDLTTALYPLIDEVERINEPDPLSGEKAGDLDPDGFGCVVRLVAQVRAILEDHRCPDTPPIETNVG